MKENPQKIKTFVKNARNAGNTWRQVADLCAAEFSQPFSDQQVRKIYTRSRRKKRVNTPLEFQTDSQSDTPAYLQYFQWIKDYQEIKGGDDGSVKRHELKSAAPYILVVFSADWHLGNFGVDYGQVESLVDFVADRPNVYLVTVGDLIDNFRRFRSTEALFGQIPPNDQYRILESLLERLGENGRHIASTWGNHDVEFDEKLSGFSYVAQLLQKNTHYFKGIGKLQLQVNEQEYIVGLTHFYKGHSMYNPVHSHIRFLREQFPDCDIVATGHKHFPAAGWWPNWQNEGAKVQYMVQVGSPKNSDTYSQRYYGRPVSGNHYFFLATGKHQVVWTPFEDIALELYKSFKMS
ncbi:MAG: hypothetical protein CV087_10480 [Candidatus Brocadia sp. WS118]|nr:MAG: hypothetical protein CV087_10480 [Candidatus Brocadia sp. WS118]